MLGASIQAGPGDSHMGPTLLVDSSQPCQHWCCRCHARRSMKPSSLLWLPPCSRKADAAVSTAQLRGGALDNRQSQASACLLSLGLSKEPPGQPGLRGGVSAELQAECVLGALLGGGVMGGVRETLKRWWGALHNSADYFLNVIDCWNVPERQIKIATPRNLVCLLYKPQSGT